MLFVIVLSPLAAVCQRLPDAPEPQAGAAQSSSSSSQSGVPQSAPSISNQQPTASGQDVAPPDAAWRKIQRLVHGEMIVVNSTLGPSLRCRFAGATDDALFCDALYAPDGTGYRFDRATVITVSVQRPERNWHPAWLASMIAGGIIVGAAATNRNDAGGAAGAGALGALVVGAIGAPLAFLQEPDRSMATVVLRPRAFRLHGHGPLGFRPRAMR